MESGAVSKSRPHVFDDKVFAKQFDCILLGTGLVQSIVAGALAYSGKSVLHLDKNEYYGGSAASLTLDEFGRWAAERACDSSTASDDGFSVAHCATLEEPDPAAAASSDESATASDVSAPSAAATEPSAAAVDDAVPAPAVSNDDGAAASTAVDAVDERTETTPPPPPQFAWSRAMLKQHARRFSLDIQPRLMLCRGALIDTLVRTNVARYLEFCSLDALAVATRGESGGSSDDDGAVGSIEVPCSKSSVFTSTTLSLREKRSLMKLLQFMVDTDPRLRAAAASAAAADAGGKGASAAAGEKGINERSLAKSRSLHRPQNKQSSKCARIFDEICSAAPPGSLEDFLLGCRISPQLRSVLNHGIVFAARAASSAPAEGASASGRVDARRGVEAIQRYVRAMGRYGSTAFLCVKYGSSEIAQAFCRLCAVHGGIYVLREPVRALTFASAEEGGQQEEEEEERPRRCVGVEMESGHALRAKWVVAGHEYTPDLVAPSGQAVARAICIVRGAVAWPGSKATTDAKAAAAKASFGSSKSGSGASLLIVPPNTVELAVDDDGETRRNPVAVHILQQSSDSRVCPRPWDVARSAGFPVEEVGSAENRLVVLHMSAVSSGSEDPQLYLEPVLRRLLRGSEGEGEGEGEGEERVMWSAYFQQHLLRPPPSSTPGLIVCTPQIATGEDGASHDSPFLEPHYEAAMVRAEAIFAAICPDEVFYPKAEVPKDAGGAPVDNSDGWQDAALVSALEMASAPPPAEEESSADAAPPTEGASAAVGEEEEEPLSK